MTVKEKNLTVDPVQFYDYFTEGNWIDAKGQKVRSWKQKILTWEKYGKGKKEEKEQIDNIKKYPHAKSVIVSGLYQDTFEYFIDNYGKQFEAITFWKNNY